MLTPPPLDSPSPVAEDLLGDDWFGDGSVFDTGEELAAALMSLSGAATSWRLAMPAPDPVPAKNRVVREAPKPAARSAGLSPAPADEFLIATMPSSRSRRPTGWSARGVALPAAGRPAAGAARTGWSIRQSVQILRVTEEILGRLREEAALLTWQLAAAAHRETDTP